MMQVENDKSPRLYHDIIKVIRGLSTIYSREERNMTIFGRKNKKGSFFEIKR